MPKIESGFNAMQDQILFAILQGNANLLTQLTQSQLGKAAFMRVYKDNFWFMDNDPTAMQAILNSPAAMQAIANSLTAMQAIANSPAAMQAIANSLTAMQAIILSQTALDQIRANSSAWQTFINSTTLTRRQVPQMTSNTAPEGTASASSIYSSDYDAFKAFDKNTGSCWVAASSAFTDQWLGYYFPAGVEVFVHTVSVRNHTSSWGAKDVRVQRSNDGTNWETVLETTLSNANSNEQVLYVSKSGYARMWRLFIVNTYGSTPHIYELNFIGFQKP